ncbi:MAG: diacylglycerol kinase family protein [Thiohalocapsa sp.]
MSTSAIAAIVVNRRSGTPGAQTEALIQRLTEQVRSAGLDVCLIDFACDQSDADQWRRKLSVCIEKGAREAYVLGGDGTVLAVASALLGRGVTLGLVPLGTANLLARDLGMSMDAEAAVTELRHARPRYIDVGRVNGELFLCASMLGMTTDLARTREAARGLGALRLLPRMLRKAYFLAKRYPFRAMTLDLDDAVLKVSTRAMVISNNPIEPEAGLYPGRQRLDTGRLGIYGVHEGPLYDLPRLGLSLILGNWPAESGIFNHASAHAVIRTRRPHRITLLIDGERRRMRTPLHFDILPAALPVLSPTTAVMDADRDNTMPPNA